ncbi:MAG: MFS transporter [Chloroflexota bacterium]
MSRPIFYGWIVAVAGMLATSVFQFVNSYSVFFPSLSRDFGWSRADVASAYSIFAIAYSLSVVPMGRLITRIGPRLVVVLGAILIGVGIGLSSTVQTIGQLRLWFGLITGLGAGALWTTPMYAVSQWFYDSKRKGLALGIVSSGAISILFPIVASHLIRVTDWRQTYAAFGIAIFAILILAAFLIRSPEPKTPKPHDANVSTPTVSSPLVHTPGPEFTVREALSSHQFWMLYTSYGLGILGLSLSLVHLVPLAGDRHISEVVAAGALSAAIAFGAGGRIVMGMVSDRIGRKPAFAFSYALQTAAMVWLSIASQSWMLYVFALLLGVSWGGWVTVYPFIFGDYFGLKHFSTVFAIATSNFAVGGAIGPYLAGWVFDHTESYTVVILISATLCAISFALSCLLPPPAKTRLNTSSL